MDFGVLKQAVELLKDYDRLVKRCQELENQRARDKLFIRQLEGREIQVEKTVVSKELLEKVQQQQIQIEKMQQKIEELTMVSSKKQKEQREFKVAENTKKQEIKQELKTKLASVLCVNKQTLIKFLTCLQPSDLVNLFQASDSLKEGICSYPQAVSLIMKEFLKFASEPKIMIEYKPLPVISPEGQEEINRLMEKQCVIRFVSQRYIPGTNFQTRLTQAVKTLLALQKTTTIATSSTPQQEKYKDLSELVIARFETDRTIELLHKSAQMFSQNPQKMGQWISFLQKSFAGFLYEGTVLWTDSKQLTQLNNFYMDKLRRANMRIIQLEDEVDDCSTRLQTELNLKDHLVKRLHQLDYRYADSLSQVLDLQQELQQFEVYNKELEVVLEQNQQKYNEDKKTLAEEIHHLRKRQDILVTQKTELLNAFADFKEMFNSLDLD